MTVFLPAPDRLRSGLIVLDTDLEEEYLGPPKTLNTAPVGGPGIAEIKPHTEAKINEARKQLKSALVNRPGYEALIITYRPGATTPKGTPVKVWAVRYEKEEKPRTGALTYLRTKPWWNLGIITIPPKIDVSTADLSVLGAAAEGAVRTRFGQFLAKQPPPHRRVDAVTTSLYKSPNERGPDVEWREMAEMYAELARTTNDEFLAELANELAASG